MNSNNIDPAEIAKFSALSSHWWDKNGGMKALHDINPLRLQWINEKSPLAGKKIIDIGCGGGILSESMAKCNAFITGVDMSEEALQVAKLHQLESGLEIEYLLNTAEILASERPNQYDIVTCLEMLEHVPNPAAIIKACADLAKPDADLFFSTINRNPKSYLFAVLGAEYLLKIIPQGTHDYAKFIRPSELAEWSRKAGLTVMNMAGLNYHLLTKQYSLTTDTSVNYLVHLKKQGS